MCIEFYKHSHMLRYLDFPQPMLVVGKLYVAMDAFLTPPNGWLEVSFPPETKQIGSTISITLGPLQNAITATISVLLVCKLNRSVFFFFLPWDVVIILFIVFLVPETTNVKGSEIVSLVWSRHWLWKKYVRTSDTYT